MIIYKNISRPVHEPSRPLAIPTALCPKSGGRDTPNPPGMTPLCSHMSYAWLAELSWAYSLSWIIETNYNYLSDWFVSAGLSTRTRIQRCRLKPLLIILQTLWASSYHTICLTSLISSWPETETVNFNIMSTAKTESDFRQVSFSRQK